jgi:hypothetical protein
MWSGLIGTENGIDPDQWQRMRELALDSMVNHYATRIAERGMFNEFLETAPPDVRAAFEAALERHETRMKAEGRPGW